MMTPEEAARTADLRLRILQNVQKGVPPETGITKEELATAISLLRKDYTAAQAKSKASGVSNPATSIPVNLNDLFTNKKSG